MTVAEMIQKLEQFPGTWELYLETNYVQLRIVNIGCIDQGEVGLDLEPGYEMKVKPLKEHK